MRYNRLRSIAELNLSPLMRVSVWSIASAACMAAGLIVSHTDMWVPLTVASVLLTNQHMRWDSDRHKNRKHEGKN